MANVDAPFGARLVRDAHGRPMGARINAYYVPSTDSNNIFIGDFVTVTGTSNTADIGTLSGHVAGYEEYKAGQLPAVAKSTAGVGNAITGVVVGVAGNPSTLASASPDYRRASTDAVVLVCDDPDALFEMQCDGTLAATDIGNNFDFAATAGSTTTGLSKNEIDNTSAGTGATVQLKLLGVSRDLKNNDVSSANCNFLVKINNHTLDSNIAGV